MSGVAGAHRSPRTKLPDSEQHQKGQPPVWRAALFGLCPECGAPTLFDGPTKFAPRCRACGLDYDVRVADPYSSYEDFDFAIPVGQSGDVFDRFTVRQEEMRQSIAIIRQALDKLDKIPDKATYRADVPDWVLPPKEEVYNDMEALIWHFKMVMGEVEVPVGEVYHCVEGGNGELGFYIVSDGGRTPFRVHLRRPCFIYYQAYPEIIKGGMLSDAILTMSSMNVIAGELDA